MALLAWKLQYFSANAQSFPKGVVMNTTTTETPVEPNPAQKIESPDAPGEKVSSTSLSSIAGGRARQRTATGVTTFSESAQTALHKAQDIASDVATKAKRTLDQTGSLVRQYPWPALAIGFTFGCLLGAALRRR
jgi:ElaB/YqjD/DUF883 family membrane-anchored ribosome-binding protein